MRRGEQERALALANRDAAAEVTENRPPAHELGGDEIDTQISQETLRNRENIRFGGTASGKRPSSVLVLRAVFR